MPAPWRGRSLSRTSTHVSVEPQKHLISEAPAGPVPPAGGTRVGENLVLLTHDASLIEALVNVVPPGSLSVVADEAALAHPLLSGHAGVVFIDAGAVDSRPGMASQLSQRLHNQLPDVVLVVAGDGAAQSELAALVTDGTIYRFVHKPVSAQRVKLFVDAAWRKHNGTSSGATGQYPALSLSQTMPILPMPGPRPWPALAAGAVAVGMAVAWYALQSSPPAPTPTPPAPQLAAPAPAAPPSVAAAPIAPEQVLVTARRHVAMADRAAHMRAAPPLVMLPVPAPAPVTVPVPPIELSPLVAAGPATIPDVSVS